MPCDDCAAGGSWRQPTSKYDVAVLAKRVRERKRGNKERERGERGNAGVCKAKVNRKGVQRNPLFGYHCFLNTIHLKGKMRKRKTLNLQDSSLQTACKTAKKQERLSRTV